LSRGLKNLFHRYLSTHEFDATATVEEKRRRRRTRKPSSGKLISANDANHAEFPLCYCECDEILPAYKESGYYQLRVAKMRRRKTSGRI
jgi:hypothetical protein